MKITLFGGPDAMTFPEESASIFRAEVSSSLLKVAEA
jgi:hypothetical protein